MALLELNWEIGDHPAWKKTKTAKEKESATRRRRDRAVFKLDIGSIESFYSSVSGKASSTSVEKIYRQN